MLDAVPCFMIARSLNDRVPKACPSLPELSFGVSKDPDERGSQVHEFEHVGKASAVDPGFPRLLRTVSQRVRSASHIGSDIRQQIEVLIILVLAALPLADL